MPTKRKFRRNNNRKSRRRGKRGGMIFIGNKAKSALKKGFNWLHEKKNNEFVFTEQAKALFGDDFSIPPFNVNKHAEYLINNNKVAANKYANEFYFKREKNNDEYDDTDIFAFPSKNLKIKVTPKMKYSYNLKEEEDDEISYEELVKQMITRYYEIKKTFWGAKQMVLVKDSEREINGETTFDRLKENNKVWKDYRKAFCSMALKDLIILTVEQYEKAEEEAGGAPEGAPANAPEEASSEDVKKHFSKFGELGTYQKSTEGWLNIRDNYITAPWVQKSVLRYKINMRGIMFGIWVGILGGKYGGGDHGFDHKNSREDIKNHVSDRMKNNKLDLIKIFNVLKKTFPAVKKEMTAPSKNGVENTSAEGASEGGRRRRRKRRTKRRGKSRRKRRTKRRRRRKTR